MDSSTGLLLNTRGYWARQLEPHKDEGIVQQLYEQCTDYSYLIDGHPPSSSAAREEFLAVPEGKTLQDKLMIGLFDASNILVGLIEGIRHYPNNSTWWVGLMMLAPLKRGKGNGYEFYRAFERWASAHGAQQVSLSVVEENEQGFRFWKKVGFEVIRKTPPRQFGKKTHALYVMSRTVDITNSDLKP